MRITVSGRRVVLRDNPGGEWFVALFFGSVGVLLAIICVKDYRPLDSSLGAVFCFAALATSVWLVRSSPVTTVVVDGAARHVRLRRSWLVRASERDLPFAAVAGAEVDEIRDSDGDPCWRPVLRLRDGSTLPLSAIWRHDRPGIQAAVHQVSRLLGTR